MDLMQLAKTFPEMTVSIRLRDLMAANEALVRKVRTEVEKEYEKRRREYGDELVPRKDARPLLGNPDNSTLWRWENAGYLTKVKIGEKVFYRKSEIQAIITAHETN